MSKDIPQSDFALTPTDRRKVTGRIARRGYAALPGTGPKGEFCKTCEHIVRIGRGKTYLKCEISAIKWTGGQGTDILANAPACSKWEPKA